MGKAKQASAKPKKVKTKAKPMKQMKVTPMKSKPTKKSIRVSHKAVTSKSSRPATLASWGELDGSGKRKSFTVKDLRTPCLVVYKSVLERNAQTMLKRAKDFGCDLRPHMKTHKTLEGGAICTGGTKRRIVVSTLAEAEFFADGGFDDILYAVPITADKLPTAAALVRRLKAFHIVLDEPSVLEAVLSRTPHPKKKWSIFIMVDCGYGRDGVDPNDPSSFELVKRICPTQGSCEGPVARLGGLYTHGGHSYDAASVSQVREIGEAEVKAVADFASKLRASGTPVPVVGVGSTPTCSNPPLQGLPGVNEMHPGNYCYYDVMQSDLGSCTDDDIAVRLVVRIVGQYPKQNTLLMDMGWTGCSKQGESVHYGRIEGHPELIVKQLKQEAGLITTLDGQPLDFARFPIGTFLRLKPFHSCASTKQHDRVHVLDDDRDTVIDTWTICRGW